MFELSGFFAGSKIPQLHELIRAGAGQLFSIGADGEIKNRIGVSLPGVQDASIFRRECSQPTALGRGAIGSHQAFAVRREFERIDSVEEI